MMGHNVDFELISQHFRGQRTSCYHTFLPVPFSLITTDADAYRLPMGVDRCVRDQKKWHSKRKRGQVYDWHRQQDIMDSNAGTTSGAAAVIARRLQEPTTASSSTSHGRKRVHTATVEGTSTAVDTTTPTASTRHRTRRHDGQLVFTLGALTRLHGKISPDWRWHNTHKRRKRRKTLAIHAAAR